MQDVNQILIWETRRKALQWWNNLTLDQQYSMVPEGKKLHRLTDAEIEEIYQNRP